MIGHIETFADQRLSRAMWRMDDRRGARGERSLSRVAVGVRPRRPSTRFSRLKGPRAVPWQRVAWYWGDERFVPHDLPTATTG